MSDIADDIDIPYLSSIVHKHGTDMNGKNIHALKIEQDIAGTSESSINAFEDVMPGVYHNTTDSLATTQLNHEETESMEDANHGLEDTNPYSGDGDCIENTMNVDEGFALTRNLTKHRTIHTENKSYQCKLCQQKLTHMSGLKAHMRTHTGEKPFQCAVCDISFTQGRTLGSHIRTHTGDKQYQCTLCQKMFTQTSNLNQHMKTHKETHTGRRPYQCTTCDKAFTLKGNETHAYSYRGETLSVFRV